MASPPMGAGRLRAALQWFRTSHGTLLVLQQEEKLKEKGLPAFFVLNGFFQQSDSDSSLKNLVKSSFLTAKLFEF